MHIAHTMHWVSLSYPHRRTWTRPLIERLGFGTGICKGVCLNIDILCLLFPFLAMSFEVLVSSFLEPMNEANGGETHGVCIFLLFFDVERVLGEIRWFSLYECR